TLGASRSRDRRLPHARRTTQYRNINQRDQIATLTAELGRVDSELAALATTRTTLRTLAATEFTADDPTIASTPYQQILEVLAAAPAGMRAKGICSHSASNPHRSTSKAPARSSNAWSTAAS
ncbi:hypothetical protein ACFHWS_25000, partial [Micromonospora sp. LOL_013]